MRLAVALTVAAALAVAAPSALAQGPTTGFEQRDGASWTTHAEEVSFLNAVAASPRVRLSEIARTKQGRPMHLVQIGAPGPATAEQARSRPTALLVCSQHGNEPAGREACLKLLRELAFTSDAGLVDLLSRTTFLFVPSANPDGREANQRGNADGTDVNRDHLGLDTPEAQAMAAVVRDWEPDVAVDLHEYGPSQPIIYDDSVLWLWPRNLNTDPQVHDLAVELGRKYLVPAANDAGYSTDEYGQAEVADNDVAQTAGDGDEGIMRNAMGLRHVLGILVETRVDADVRQSPTEPLMTAQVQRRRVDSHGAVLRGLLRFMRERGGDVARVTAEAERRKIAEGAARNAPVYFGGADNTEPAEEDVVNPPPCGYRLSEQQVAALGPRLALHGIDLYRVEGGPFVPLAQSAEPLIPLLLDARGTRKKTDGQALDRCPVIPGVPVSQDPPAGGSTTPAVRAVAPLTGPSCSSRRTVLLRLTRRRGKYLRTTVTANGKRQRVRRNVAYVQLATLRGTVRVRIVQTRRFRGKVRTFKQSRTLRVCP